MLLHATRTQPFMGQMYQMRLLTVHSHDYQAMGCLSERESMSAGLLKSGQAAK